MYVLKGEGSVSWCVSQLSLEWPACNCGCWPKGVVALQRTWVAANETKYWQFNYRGGTTSF